MHYNEPNSETIHPKMVDESREMLVSNSFNIEKYQ